MHPTAPAATVAILTFPETSASTVFGMYDLFMSAGRDWGYIVGGEPGPSLMHAILVGREAGPVVVTNGVPVTLHASIAEFGPGGRALPSIICVPDLNVPFDADLALLFGREIAWLALCYKEGATLAASCSGALLLAAAGVLDGHEATTHWAFCDTLQRRYPQVKVRAQRALVVSGDGHRLVMAGAGTSWIDLALYLVARSVGADVAMQLAKVYLVDWHTVGQQPYACLTRKRQVDDAAVAQCQAWIAEHYRQPAPVAAMARLSGIPERSFKRRFEQATGMPPLEYVHTLRLEEAKQMLETGTDSIAAIAGEVGYEDAGFFGRLFRRQVGLTPAQYRKRFRSMRKSLESPDAP